MTAATGEIQLENGTFRVTKWTIEPGAEIRMHRHDHEYVVIPLTTGPMVVTNADGTVINAELVEGVSYTRPAGSEHRVANRSEHGDVIFIEVERLS